MAANWFYAMAGGSVLGLIILFLLEPVDFNVLLIKRLKEQGVKYQVEDRTNTTECFGNDGIPKKNIPERNTIQKEHSVLQKTQQQHHHEENQSISNDSVIDEIPAQSAITGL